MINSYQEIKIKSFEAYIAEGIVARQSKDNSCWKLGDLALLIEKDYGHDSIGEFAQSIGVEKKTLMNYRTCSARFSKEIRDMYNLSFSHFITVIGVKTPDAWLSKSLDEKWSVERLRTEIKKAYEDTRPATLTDDPPPVFECNKCKKWRLKDMSAFDICRGHYEWRNGQAYYE